jgi:hypothetical protein
MAFSALLIAVAGVVPARGCGLELVLAMDVSQSVDDAEYGLQIGGLAEAFRDPGIAHAIATTPGGIMATVSQWSGPDSQIQSVPWTHLTDAASAGRFAEAVARQHRAFSAYTAIGAALTHASALLAENARGCARKVIDVSGDGASNQGATPSPIAEALAARGVTVNGLVILGAWPDPAEYYRRHVVRGDGAFLETAASFADYAAAIWRKLLRELDPQLAGL